MSEFETLGYVLSPAKPPKIKAALLEEQAGEVSVGDLVAIPIILDDKFLYIFGTVLSIETHRPLLDIGSKAPYALTRGDTMNLLEDSDMLVPSELEDISYVAEIYLHSLLYDKFYGVHVVIPGSKIVKVPEEIVKKALPSEGVEIGSIRGYDLSVKIPKEEIFESNLLIVGGKRRLEIAKKIAENLDASLRIYAGRKDIGREEVESLEDAHGNVKHTSLDDIINYLRRADEKTVLILDNAATLGASFRLLIGPISMKPNIATIILSDLVVSTLLSVFRRFVKNIIFLEEPSLSAIYEDKEKAFTRMDVVRNLGEEEFFLLSNALRFPIVGTLKL